MFLQKTKDFVVSFAEFYKKSFESSAELAEMLADIQKKYLDEYNKIREFSSDPTAVMDLVKKLEPKKQAILLNILLQAGDFGKRMSTLFDSSPEEKLKLAKDLRKFAKELPEILTEGAKK